MPFPFNNIKETYAIAMDDLIKEIKEERRWHRRSLAILTYHTFQQLANKDSKRGAPDNWTIEKTAEVLGLSVGYVSESIKLAKAYPDLDDDPALSREQALRKLNGRN